MISVAQERDDVDLSWVGNSRDGSEGRQILEVENTDLLIDWRKEGIKREEYRTISRRLA